MPGGIAQVGLVLQPHQAIAADLVQKFGVILHAVDPLLQVILKGLGDGGAGGGVIGVVREGDRIRIDIPGNKLELLVGEEELAARMKDFVPKKKALSGYLKRYAALVSSGASGAVLN